MSWNIRHRTEASTERLNNFLCNQLSASNEQNLFNSAIGRILLRVLFENSVVPPGQWLDSHYSLPGQVLFSVCSR